MKTSLSFIMFLSFLFCSFSADNKTSELSITDAIKKGLVTFSVKGVGGHSGLTMKGTVRNKSAHAVNVVIPAGIVMAPDDTSMQNLVLVRTERIVLRKGEVKLVDLYGYCCNASERSPSEGMSFTPTLSKSPKLKDLAEFISKNQFPQDAIQNAVWSVSDGKSISQIYADDHNTVIPLRAEVSRLTGQKDDWYSIQATTTVDEEGYMQNAPVMVKGEIRVHLDRKEKIRQEVCKESGEVVWSPSGFLEMPTPGTFVYSFKLKVSGWDPGKYYVRVSVPGKVILKQEFTI